VLKAEVITGQMISEAPGEIVFTVTADEINQNPTDFEFDTSGGLGQQQIRIRITPCGF